MLIKIRNPIELAREHTTISSTLSASSTEVTLRNTDGLAANDYVVIGRMGSEQAELERISSVDDATTITLASAVSFQHDINTQVSTIPFNQVEISRKTTASGSWSVLTTTDLQVDSLQTAYDDTSGQSSYFYRVRFKNENSGQFSDYSSELKGTGFDSRTVKPMIDTILRRLGDPQGEFTSREDVRYEIQLKYEDVTNGLVQSSAEYYRKEIEVPMEPFKYEYTLPDDFKEIHEVRNGDGTKVEPLPNDVLGATGIDGYELTGRNRVYFNNVPTPATDDVSPTTILSNNAFDEDGTWTAGDDGANVTTDTDEFKVGTGSINFDIDVSQDADNKVTLTNSTFTSTDLSDYEDTGRIRVWVYLPDVTYITSVNLKWGSDSSNTWDLTVTKDYKDHAFRDGWNLLEFDWSSSDVTETGSPDDEAVDYIQLTINYSSSQGDDEDFRLDAIRIANTFSGNDVYRLIYFRNPDKITNEMDQLDIPVGYGSVLLDGVIAELMIRYENRDTLTQRLIDRSDKRQGKFLSQASKRTRRPIGPRPFGRKRRYSSRSGFKNVHTNYDVYFPRDD